MKKSKIKENHAGRLGDLTVDGLSFGVRITDGPRYGFGRYDYRIEPLNGSGAAWVTKERVTLRPGASEVKFADDCQCGAEAKLSQLSEDGVVKWFSFYCPFCRKEGPRYPDLCAAANAWNAMQIPAEEKQTPSPETEVPV